MSKDLVLKNTKRNCARGASSSTTAPSDEARLAALAKVRMAAEGGDKKAQKQWKKICKKVDKLRKKAKKGDPIAQLDLKKLENSGLFGPVQKIAVTGAAPRKPSFKTPYRRYRNERDRNFLSGAFVGREELMGAFVGEEERELAAEGGSCEREALSRRTGLSSEDGSNVGSSLSHSAYRATVMKQAIRGAGGKAPSTKDLFVAKKKVDAFLNKAGVGIFLPGARPGRRTI